MPKNPEGRVMKKRKGAVLVLVLCIFVIITMLIGILSSYFMTNSALAVKQRERMQAYYVVAAGLEIAISALMEPAVNAAGDQYYPLMEHYAGSLVSDSATIDLGDGREVTITICAVDQQGKDWVKGKSTGDVWIRIAAIGTYRNSNGDTIQAGNLRINSKNPASIIREMDRP
jgi:hypothetical protein